MLNKLASTWFEKIRTGPESQVCFVGVAEAEFGKFRIVSESVRFVPFLLGRITWLEFCTTKYNKKLSRWACRGRG